MFTPPYARGKNAIGAISEGRARPVPTRIKIAHSDTARTTFEPAGVQDRPPAIARILRRAPTPTETIQQCIQLQRSRLPPV
jgi:hypothetical protein